MKFYFYNFTFHNFYRWYVMWELRIFSILSGCSITSHTIYSIYIIEFGYLSPKYSVLLFQTLQAVFNVGCIVTILNLHSLLSWIHSFADNMFFPFLGCSLFVLKHIFWELGPLDSTEPRAVRTRSTHFLNGSLMM